MEVSINSQLTLQVCKKMYEYEVKALYFYAFIVLAEAKIVGVMLILRNMNHFVNSNRVLVNFSRKLTVGQDCL